MSEITIDTEDPEIRAILGLMCFTTAPIAHVLQASGEEIPSKIEEEQAAVFLWLIEIYVGGGYGDWRAVATQRLRGMREKIEAKKKEKS